MPRARTLAPRPRPVEFSAMTPETRRAAVRSPVAPLFAEPRVASVQVSQLLAGHPVELVDERDGWWCVRGLDRYEGWMHLGYLADAGAFPTAATGGSRLSLGCVTERDGGGRRALPLGAYLQAGEQVVSGEVIDAADRQTRFPLNASAITSTALRYFEGASYLWGGVTPWGADCSGLVQACFSLHGLVLPRDAWQQASQGAPGHASPLEAREGDLLFFSDRDDRHVTHVALALGERRVVHLALTRGGFAVERLDDADDPFVRALVERFTVARRVLPSAAS